MDYSNMKKSDYIYLAYRHEIKRRGHRTNVHTVITFKNNNDRFYAYHSKEDPHPTIVTEANPIVILMYFAYFQVMRYFISPIINTQPLIYYILAVLALIGSYLWGKFPRLWFGVKKVDVTNLEKISVEEIQEKHMKKLWKNINFSIAVFAIIIFTIIFLSITSGQPINEVLCALTLPIFYIGYLDLINRVVSMLKIEKEFNSNRKKAGALNKENKLDINYLRKQDYVYLPIIDKPAKFLSGYPEVTSIVTLKNNSEKFIVFEKGDLFKKIITLTFYRRTIGYFAWALYFIILFTAPATVTENLGVMMLISAIPMIIGVCSFFVLANSLDGKGKIDITKLKEISITEIQETYLKKIWKNIRADFLYSFVWVAFLIFIPLSDSINTEFDIAQRFGIFFIILMLILRFINIYRRVVATRKIEKEF